MKTTLTLTLEQEMVKTMNDYAHKRGSNISELVKNYFYLITRNDDYLENIPTTPIANSLMGSLKAPDNLDDKQELANALIKKHL